MSSAMFRFDHKSGSISQSQLTSRPQRPSGVYQFMLEHSDGSFMIYSTEVNDVTQLYPLMNSQGIFSTIKEAEDYRDSLPSDVT